MFKAIQNWFVAQAEYGLDALPEQERSGRFAFNVTTLLGGYVTLPYLAYYIFAGVPLLALVVCPIVLSVFAPRIIAKVPTVLALLFFGSVMMGCFVTATYLTGASSGVYLFMLNGLLSLPLQQASISRAQMRSFQALF